MKKVPKTWTPPKCKSLKEVRIVITENKSPEHDGKMEKDVHYSLKASLERQVG